MKNKLDARLAKLETEQVERMVQALTDVELQALLDKDPAEAAILNSMTDEDLQRLAAGDRSATATFYAKVKRR